MKRTIEILLLMFFLIACNTKNNHQNQDFNDQNFRKAIKTALNSNEIKLTLNIETQNRISIFNFQIQ